MKYLVLYWSFLIIGYVVVRQLKKRGKNVSWVSRVMMGVIYCLCFVMGLRMGVNKQVTSNLGTIGLEALLLTAVCVAGSMFAIFALRRILHMNRYGDVVSKGSTDGVETCERTSGDEKESLDLKSTFVILSVVALGMVVGALIIARRLPLFLVRFDAISSNALVVLLCILMFFVGLEMGSGDSILETIRKVGPKVLVFPLAAIAGTMVLGTAFCMVIGFSLKEGLSICAGFGWYTYAPVVIASAGQQYMIASAVSFMHNVTREVTGIILIPILARKFGYIECTGVPGCAAMDVCVPIVEKSCRQETVVYSFTTGLMMCVFTSIFTPLFMGV